MNVRISLRAAAMGALAALGLSACATTATSDVVDVAQVRAAGDICRLVQSGDDPEGTVMCGNAEQWAEFDRRAALINAGVTCEWAPIAARELCMTQEQWALYERRVDDMAEVRRGGSMAGSGANFGVPMTSGLMATPFSAR